MGSRREASTALVIWFCLLSSSVGQETKYWQWEAKKPFHNAIVFVRCRLSENSWSNGSGTIVAADEKNCWIVTAAHIFQSSSAPEMSWDGVTWAVGRFLAKDDESDVAIVWQPTLMKAYAAQLATESPKPGDVLSFAGYGGPGSQMRRWTAKTKTEMNDETLVGDTSVLEGDSGGGVFNQQGHLVGVISGGRRLQSFGLVADGKDFKLHHPTICSNVKPIRSLFGRFRQRRNSTPQGIIVPQGGCGPDGCMPQGGAPQYIMPVQPQGQPEYTPPPEQAAPVVTPTNPPLVPPAVVPPATAACPGLDEFKAQMAKDIEALNVKIMNVKDTKGDKGDKGEPGKDGAPATVDLNALVAKLTESLKADPSFAASCKGSKGEPGKDGAAATIDLEALTTKLVEHLKADPSFIQSVKGEKGDPGGIGSDANVDVDALAVLVTKKLPDIQVLFLGKDDVQHSVQYVKLGGILKIPPVILSKRENGKTFTQVKALGDKINLELVPIE